MSRIVVCTYWKRFAVSSIAITFFLFAEALIAIVTENALPGNPPSKSNIAEAGNLCLQDIAAGIHLPAPIKADPAPVVFLICEHSRSFTPYSAKLFLTQIKTSV